LRKPEGFEAIPFFTLMTTRLPRPKGLATTWGACLASPVTIAWLFGLLGHVRYSFIFAGFGLLLCSSFLDSLRGPLLPVLSAELSMDYEQVSLFLVGGYLSAMAFGRFVVFLIGRFSFQKVAARLSLLAPLTALLAYQVQGLTTLIVFGALVACTSASVGSTANLFILSGTESAYRARFYGLLHAMYGLGSQAAPWALGACMAAGRDWRELVVIIAVPFLALGAWVQWGLPVEKAPSEETAAPIAFRWVSLQGLLVVAFCAYVAGEVLCSMWLVAFLVEIQSLSIEAATPYATGFFIVLMLSRLGLFWVKSAALEKALIRLSLLVGLVGFVLGLNGWAFGFALTGCIGPYFPLVLARISRVMPREAPGLTLRILIAVQGTLAACHFGMGAMAKEWGLAAAYRAPVFALSLAILLMAFYFRLEASNARTRAASGRSPLDFAAP
jgi:fucose permease